MEGSYYDNANCVSSDISETTSTEFTIWLQTCAGLINRLFKNLWLRSTYLEIMFHSWNKIVLTSYQSYFQHIFSLRSDSQFTCYQHLNFLKTKKQSEKKRNYICFHVKKLSSNMRWICKIRMTVSSKFEHNYVFTYVSKSRRVIRYTIRFIWCKI